MKHTLQGLKDAIESLKKAKGTVEIYLEVYEQKEKIQSIDEAILLLNECYEMIEDHCEGEE